MSKDKFNWLTLIVIACCFGLAGYFRFFAGNDTAKEYLKDHGYQKVVVSAGSFWGCSKNEFGTTFSAVDKSGSHVSGQVCTSLFLKPAIRLD